MQTARYSHPRAGYRSAQDLLFLPSLAPTLCAFRGAVGGTVGGSADDCILLRCKGLWSRTWTFQFLMVVVAWVVEGTAFGEAAHRFPAARSCQHANRTPVNSHRTWSFPVSTQSDVAVFLMKTCASHLPSRQGCVRLEHVQDGRDPRSLPQTRLCRGHHVLLLTANQYGAW